MTEPTSGTDTTALQTVARREGDEYVVNGQKIWTSPGRAFRSDAAAGAHHAKDQTAKRTDGLSVFLVDMREALGNGLTIRPIRTMMNHATTEVFFDDLRVPAANLIGEEGKGFRYILSGMNAERILIARRMHRRRQMVHRQGHGLRQATGVVFGRPIGQNQGIQFPDRQGLCADARRRADGAPARRPCSTPAKPCGAEANMAKLLAAEASWAAGDACVQTHGGFGFAEEYDVERKFRETRLYQVAPISTNLILSYLAEHVLGLPRSY